MWKTLTSDLNEFVSTVAGDTSEVLNRLDQNFPDGSDEHEELSPAAEERLRRMELRETFDSPLISDDDDEDYKKDVGEFLEKFSVEERTEEISKLLEENPDTLKVCFETLVPTKVKYDDFWQRYFYRCDEERINAEIEEEEARAEASRANAYKSISAVGSLFGGAVKAVSGSLKEGKHSEAQTKTSDSGGFFGSSKRPPFVLNTAVSEGEDGDEDEEELGWDDDEEGDGEGDDDDDDGEDQIEFNDVATENLREQLKRAVEERDQLHETVELQKKEIHSLKQPGSENAEIEKLKTQLFEKESELAALRASKLDDSAIIGDASSSQHADQIESLTQKINTLEKKSETDSKALEEERKNKGELQTMVSTLESKVKELEKELQTLKAENASLKTSLDGTEKGARSVEDTSQRKDTGETSVDSPETGSSVVKVDKEMAKTADDWDDDW